MRLRNVKNADNIVNNHPLVIKEVTENTFNNKYPLHIEIGMGKGDFIVNMSKKYPHINFIGIEKYASVLVRGLEKIEESENLRFMMLDASEIEELFKVKIDVLYLNFSDPWPKKKHAKRRLTHETFLKKYENIFKNDVHIYLKTDNKGFFASSVCSLSLNGYIIDELSLDLANTDIPNVETEYENKFKARGETINYLHAIKKL